MISKNAFYRLILTVFILLLCLRFSMADEAVNTKNSFQGEFQLDRDISLDISWGIEGKPVMLKLSEIRFSQSRARDGSFVISLLNARIKHEILSWPRTSWRLELVLLDSEGRAVGHAKPRIENSGVIFGRPGHTKGELDFSIDFWKPIETVSSFQLSLTKEMQAGDGDNLKNFELYLDHPDPSVESFRGEFAFDRDLPVQLEWGPKGKENILTINTVRFEKRIQSYGSFELVQLVAILKTTVVSYPKISAMIDIILLDDKGDCLGKGSMHFANSGIIISFAMISTQDKEITIQPGGDMDLARKFKITVTRVMEKGDIPMDVSQQKLPEGFVNLCHTDNTSEGKRSLGASGHAVDFQRPEKGRFVEAVQIFASRYGHEKPPEDDFHLYILNEKKQVLADVPFPYKLIARGDMKWYTLRTPSIEVPDRFSVALSFNPHRTKGVYLGYDEDVSENHSLKGLPDEGYEKVEKNYDWMLRACLSENPTGEKGIIRLSEFKPPVYIDPFQGLVKIGYDSGESEHMQSYGGRGPAVRIDLTEPPPRDVFLLKGIRLYASRYGSGYDTEETSFYLAILDSEKRLLREFAFPYGKFSYKVKWVDLELNQPVPVKKGYRTIYIAIDPEAHRTRGIYFRYNRDPEKSHSLVGKIGRDFKELPEREWVMRFFFEKRERLENEPRYIVRFSPTSLIHPECGRDLFKAFYDALPEGVNVFHFRSVKDQGGDLSGSFIVVGERGKKAVQEMMNWNQNLRLNEIREASEKDVADLAAMDLTGFAERPGNKKTSRKSKARRWGPEQATGEPDTNRAGDIPTAWASLTEDDREEWLVLEYEKAVIPSRIEIHETYNPGAVSRVAVFDEKDNEIEAWKGNDPTPPGSKRGISRIPLDVSFETKKIKITLDSRSVRGWNEIDAVALVDGEGGIQWAIKAEASTTYAEK